MLRPWCIALVVGTAMAAVPEWRGVFHTPSKTYKWSAEKVGGKYADASMKIVALPVTNPTAAGAMAAQETAGVAALKLTCTDVQSGGTFEAKAGACYRLVFNDAVAKSEYTVDATNANGIVFFCEHVPTEFEATQHYLKDTTGVDIEPVEQNPVPSGAGHAHSHGTWSDEYEGKCVCQAKAHSWTLNCADKPKIVAAVAALKADAQCKKKGASQTCTNNYYVMQAHHDHCLHNDLPTNIEKDFHDYEHFYDNCMVKRQFNANLGQCPAVTCTDQTTMTNQVAALKLAGNNCNTTSGCAVKVCADAIKVVLAAHDTCSKNQLPDSLEDALHNYEEACEAQLCNTAGAAFDPYADSCSANVASFAVSIHDSTLAKTWVLVLALLVSLYSRHS